MAKVYVTQETSYDFTPAKEYGEVVFCTNKDFHNVEGPHNAALREEIERKVDDFNFNTDWVIITGSPYVAAMVFRALGYMALNPIKVLRWNNRDHRYIPMNV